MRGRVLACSALLSLCTVFGWDTRTVRQSGEQGCVWLDLSMRSCSLRKGSVSATGRAAYLPKHFLLPYSTSYSEQTLQRVGLARPKPAILLGVLPCISYSKDTL